MMKDNSVCSSELIQNHINTGSSHHSISSLDFFYTLSDHIFTTTVLSSFLFSEARKEKVLIITEPEAKI